MTYAELITKLEACSLAPDQKAHVARAREYLDTVGVMPGALRQYVRKLWEGRKAAECDRLRRDGTCGWLSRRQGIGASVACPFYAGEHEPQECHGFRAAQPIPTVDWPPKTRE